MELLSNIASNEKFKNSLYQGIIWAIIALGIFFRLDQYLFNRSLWLDEAFIAADVVNKTLWELLSQPLDYSDSYKVPPGFFVATKLLTTFLGNTDFTLRLFPFLCGIFSLLLYFFMAKRYVSRMAVPLALLLFAVSDALIFYTSEFKQYSSDVLFTIILFLIAIEISKQELTTARLLFLTIIGSMIVWFSHPVVFILATLGSFLFFQALLAKNWKKSIKITLMCSTWFTSFIILYLLFIRVDYSISPISQYLVSFFVKELDVFMPLELSWHTLQWLHKISLEVLAYPANLHYLGLAAFFFLGGCLALLNDNKKSLFFLALPILLTLLLSAWKQYPFYGRLILFLLPSFYLILAEGIVKIRLHFVKSNSFPRLTVLWLPILGILLIATSPVYEAFERLKSPHVKEEIKPILAYLQQKRQPSEIIYLYHWIEPAFRYYGKFYGLNDEDCHLINHIPNDEYTKEIDYFRQNHHFQPTTVDNTSCVLGISELFEQSQADLKKLAGKGKVWFVFSHFDHHQLNQFFQFLDTMGEKVDELWQSGAYICAYQL